MESPKEGGLVTPPPTDYFPMARDVLKPNASIFKLNRDAFISLIADNISATKIMARTRVNVKSFIEDSFFCQTGILQEKHRGFLPALVNTRKALGLYERFFDSRLKFPPSQTITGREGGINHLPQTQELFGT